MESENEKIIKAIMEVNNILSKLAASLDIGEKPPIQDYCKMIKEDPSKNKYGLPVDTPLRIGDKFILRYMDTIHYEVSVHMLCTGPTLINQDNGLSFSDIRDYPCFSDDKEVTLGDFIKNLPLNFEIVAYIMGPLSHED